MADSLTCISSIATRGILRKLAASYETASGRPIALESVGGVDATRRVRAGELFDVVVLSSDALARLETDKHIASGSRVDFVRSVMAIAVRAGAARPPIGDAAALRQASLDARSVGYSTGPSGDHLKRLWELWGIDEQMARKAVLAVPGQPVAGLVANGEAELGFQQLSELINQPGIEVLGPMPDETRTATIFAAGIAAASQRRNEAAGFLAFITSPETKVAKGCFGLGAC